ncbi:CHAP domain-containing protein [Candidatus Roizmanbacteria bacterium]|nr:MAG: CHAP domain-containing protein [Candidatus Roizmanbacteria bacterium]
MKKISILLLLLFLLFMSSATYSRASNEESSAEKVKKPARNLFYFFKDIGNNSSPDTGAPDPTLPPDASPAPTYGPPPAPIYDTQLANLMEAIKQKAHSNCTMFGTGIVATQNSYCVQPIANVSGIQNGQSVVNDMKYSADNYYYLQCVGCAVAMAKANGKPYLGWGNAKQHADQSVLGYTYVPYTSASSAYSVKPGSLFILTGGTYGHIGMVSEIIYDENNRPHSFRGFECNYQANGYVSHEKTWAFDQIAGFQVPN